MHEPQEGDFDVWGDLNFSNEAVMFNGETDGWATVHHESINAQKLHSVVSQVGGEVIGDEAIYI